MVATAVVLVGHSNIYRTVTARIKCDDNRTVMSVRHNDIYRTAIATA